MIYEPNPKHKPVPTPGRRGTICPRNADGPQLLATSVLDGRKRYATDGEAAFCGQCHDASNDRWHGYPVGWAEVPPNIIHRWVTAGKVSRRVLRRAQKDRR
jgi:hypothetical protein